MNRKSQCEGQSHAPTGQLCPAVAGAFQEVHRASCATRESAIEESIRNLVRRCTCLASVPRCHGQKSSPGRSRAFATRSTISSASSYRRRGFPTSVVVVVNSWNRLCIGFKSVPGSDAKFVLKRAGLN